jgi:hypothetical protein
VQALHRDRAALDVCRLWATVSGLPDRGPPFRRRGPSSIKTLGSVAGSLKIDHNSELTPSEAARYRNVCTESIRLRMKIRRT